MPGSLVVLGAVAALLSALSLAAVVRYRRRTRAQRAHASELDARLADAMGPGAGTHLERPPTVRRIAVVDASSDTSSEVADAERDDRPAYVPVVRVDLETSDAPGTKLVLEYVADVLETIHPELEARGERVRHYDIEFTFGPDGLIVAGECRRVSVAPELADRLLESERYGASELRRDVERDDRDDDSPTTLWGDCRSYPGRY
ncbi:hypothetical protein [Natronorubrum sp. FCH18a]|uniref:hypothetical protein n=1 Tax=Natronorubrum sp. FCH18a TaxID=3447018 RepID=UPI003F51116F